MSSVPFDKKDTLEQKLGPETLDAIAKAEGREAFLAGTDEEFDQDFDKQVEIGMEVIPLAESMKLLSDLHGVAEIFAIHVHDCDCTHPEEKVYRWDPRCAPSSRPN